MPFTLEELSTAIDEYNDKQEADSGDYDPEYFYDEINWESDDSILLPKLGAATCVETFGGEGHGDNRWIVFKVQDRFFRVSGYYSSWGESDWDGGLEEVEPYEVTETKYRPIKTGDKSDS